MDKQIPGTKTEFKNSKVFDTYKEMIEIGNGLSLSQVCSITNLEPHMIQNWVKRGDIPHPIKKKYYSNHLARILLINSLRECMYIEDIKSLMTDINGDVDDQSDDRISEEELYKLFSNIVYELDDLNKIDELVDKHVKDSVINKSIKVMIYAYVSSQMSKKSSSLLKELNKGEKKNVRFR